MITKIGYEAEVKKLKEYLEAGEFVTTHGIGGELKLYPWCDGPEFLLQFKRFYLDANGSKPIQVAAARPHKGMCLVKLQGVASIEEARPYVGRRVWISRADAALEEGRFFVQDLLGAIVENADTGKVYGSVKNVLQPGKHDVYEVEAADGAVHLFPAVDAFVVSRDIEAGRVLVRPIPGMLGEGGQAEEPNPKAAKKKKAPPPEGRNGHDAD